MLQQIPDARLLRLAMRIAAANQDRYAASCRTAAAPWIQEAYEFDCATADERARRTLTATLSTIEGAP